MKQSSQSEILTAINRLRRRATLVSVVHYGLKSLFYCLLAGSLAVLVVPDPPLGMIAVWTLLAAAVATAGMTLQRNRSAAAVAKACDDREGLKDRLSSTVELIRERGPMVEALRLESARSAVTVRPRSVFPLRVPIETAFLPLPALLLVLALFPWHWLRPEQQDVQLVEALGEQVSQLEAFISRERDKDPTPRREELLARLERIKSELTRDKLDKKDALAELAKLMEKIEREKDVEEEKKLELEELIKSFRKNDRTRQLADELNDGDYKDAMAKVKEMLDELREEIERKKADGEDVEELLKELEELEEVLAELENLINVQYDIDSMAEVIEFLGQCEGSLGDIPDPDIIDAKYLRLGQCQGKGDSDKLLRISQRLINKESTRAGKATVDDWFGDPTLNDVELEEHKVTAREGAGKSSFTQTQVANDGSKSQLGEREVYLSERRAAEDTIQRQDVPAGYREYIRRYFEGIQPDTDSE